MHLRNLLFAAPLVLLCACQKNAKPDDEQPDKGLFTATTYENKCTWDDSGRPSCLAAKEAISAELFSFLNANLPEGRDLRTTNPSLLASNAMADLAITQPSEVFITFVTQNTSNNNAFAYYTFPTNQPPKSQADIKKITYVFPNVKSTVPLAPGDRASLGRFEAGTSIGFVLLENAWRTDTKRPDNNAAHLCSNEELNTELDPALKKHAVLIQYAPENKLLIGFEDGNRSRPGCDHDFNDVVLYATVK